MKVILASTSPRRKELMQILGIPFTAVESGYQEDMRLKKEPKALVQFLSYKKAEAVAEKNSDALVIAADTIVFLGRQVLGKPHASVAASRMLRQISGRKIGIVTGLTVMHGKRHKNAAVTTTLNIKKLSPSEIRAYVATGEPLDKAGAFAIQGIGSVLIEKIQGDFFAAVGLPLFSLAKLLKEFGIVVL